MTPRTAWSRTIPAALPTGAFRGAGPAAHAEPPSRVDPGQRVVDTSGALGDTSGLQNDISQLANCLLYTSRCV